MRIEKSLLTIGVFLIIVSFLNLGGGGIGLDVGPNSFMGMWINTGGDFYLEVESQYNDSISIYILDYTDTLVIIKESSVENTTPLAVFYNVTQYSGTINIILPGTYAVLVTAISNDTSVHIYARPMPPMLSFTYAGIGCSVVGGGLFFIRHSIKRHDTKKS